MVEPSESGGVADVLADSIMKLSLGDAKKVGVVYDPRMMEHEDHTGSSPEVPQRIERIFGRLQDKGVAKEMVRLEFEEANRADVDAIHTSSTWDKVELTQFDPKDPFNPKERKEGQSGFTFAWDTYDNKHTFNCAKLSAGGVLRATKAVLEDEVDSAFAIVRPPGHHAGTNSIGGFCFFNNIALAAKMAIEKYGLKRVLIFDWDIHHGNGTEEIFKDENRVLYVSLHRHDKGHFYPGTGTETTVGSDKAKGFNINIPWNNSRKNGVTTQAGNPEYFTACEHVFRPIFEEFKPELVLVSSGFDCAQGDPLGCQNVTATGFSYMTKFLSSCAKGKIVVALEGGYNLDSISLGAEAVARSLLGQSSPFETIEGSEPIESLIDQPVSWMFKQKFAKVNFLHKPYWKSIKNTTLESFLQFGNRERKLCTKLSSETRQSGIIDFLKTTSESINSLLLSPDGVMYLDKSVDNTHVYSFIKTLDRTEGITNRHGLKFMGRTTDSQSNSTYDILENPFAYQMPSRAIALQIIANDSDEIKVLSNVTWNTQGKYDMNVVTVNNDVEGVLGFLKGDRLPPINTYQHDVKIFTASLKQSVTKLKEYTKAVQSITLLVFLDTQGSPFVRIVDASLGGEDTKNKDISKRVEKFTTALCATVKKLAQD